MIWDLSDPNTMRWRNEMSIAGASWTLVEEYDMKPLQP
jgi:hypothetical protein